MLCPCNRTLRFVQTATTRIAGRSKSQSSKEIRSLVYRPCCPRRPLALLTCDEICQRRHCLHHEHQRIQRTETHCTRQVRSCIVRLSEKCARPTACDPRRGQIRIECERTISELSAALWFATHIGKRHPAK